MGAGEVGKKRKNRAKKHKEKKVDLACNPPLRRDGGKVSKEQEGPYKRLISCRQTVSLS